MANDIPKTCSAAVICSNLLQFILTLFIILAFCRSKELRQRLGGLILGFAVSAFCLSILWAVNFSDFVTEDDHEVCETVGFFALFAEYNFIFYEMGLIYYLVWFFKPERSSRDVSRSNIQTRIHCCILVASLTLTLIPTVSGELGLDFYGACSKKWDEKKPQSEGVIFTIIVTALSFLANAIGLTYFNEEHDENIEERRHHRNRFWIILIITTIPVWSLAMTNIYADLRIEGDEMTYRSAFTVIHFFSIALQGLAILVLKLMEPEILKAVKRMFRGELDEFDGIQNRLIQV